MRTSRANHVFRASTAVLLFMSFRAYAQESVLSVSQDAPTVSSADRLAELEAELDDLRQLVAGKSACCSGRGASRSCASYRACGFYAGYAQLIAKPYINGNTAFRTLVPAANSREQTAFSHDFEAAPRVWLGYDTGRGHGIRATYWQFDHAPATVISPVDTNIGDGSSVDARLFDNRTVMNVGTNPGSALTAIQGIELHSFDLDVTREFQYCRLACIGSCGIRYASVAERIHYVTTTGASAGDRFIDHRLESVGPTIALETVLGSKHWGCFRYYGNVRGSMLFGEIDGRMRRRVRAPGGVNLDVEATDYEQAVFVIEGGFGAEWACRQRSSHEVFLRGGVEAQHWSQAAITHHDLADLSFLGLVFQVGFNR